jgi:5-methylcytosine-specific restriction endonuclease McrA
MQHVLVVDTDKKPCNPVMPGKARILLSNGKAAVLRRYPFTIILKRGSQAPVEPIRLKIDPGSKQTGIALVSEVTKKVLFALVLTHRGLKIKASLDSRRAIRRARRNRNTRYRAPRFLNRTKQKGRLAPSLQHRVETVMTWIRKLSRFAPVEALSQELVRFDLQQIENPEISDIKYQQGTLAGYEVRQYLLEKWGRKCSYCSAENTPLQIEHIHPKAKGGTNRISNLCLSCEPCNTKKGTQDITEFLKKKPEVLKRIQAQAKRPLKDAAAVNSTRWRLWKELTKTGLPIEAGSGGRTKFNRSVQGYPKEHWIDAACVGPSGETVVISPELKPLLVKATGHGCRQVTRTDRFGFSRQSAKKGGSIFGFKTGDIVRTTVSGGKYAGTHSGRVAVRGRGSFVITTSTSKVETSYKNCSLLHRKDGYSYSL